MPLARRARETSAAASSIGPAAPCGRSSTYAAWTFGMMSTCPSFIGWMSMNASVDSSSRTMLAGASRRTILQKIQSLDEAAMPGLSFLRRWSEDPLGDDEFLDFVRAFVEAEDPRIAIVPLDVEFAAEPVPAMDLDGPIRDPLRHLRPEELGHRDFERLVLPQIPQVGGDEREQWSRVYIHRGLAAALGDELEEADRPAERLALFDVFRRGLQGGPGHADGSGRDAGAPCIERSHCLAPPVPFLSVPWALRGPA